jgi:hypothetical protein
VILLVAGLAGCFAPVSPGQRLNDAARELNVGTRFGKMDFVVVHVDANAQSDFMQCRVQWGKEVRLVDVELVGIQLLDPTHATTTVDVSWVPLRDEILRATRITQNWEDAGRGWKLVGEHKSSGDPGLFGEVLVLRNQPRPDVHLPSRTLGTRETSQ